MNSFEIENKNTNLKKKFVLRHCYTLAILEIQKSELQFFNNIMYNNNV